MILTLHCGFLIERGRCPMRLKDRATVSDDSIGKCLFAIRAGVCPMARDPEVQEENCKVLLQAHEQYGQTDVLC